MSAWETVDDCFGFSTASQTEYYRLTNNNDDSNSSNDFLVNQSRPVSKTSGLRTCHCFQTDFIFGCTQSALGVRLMTKLTKERDVVYNLLFTKVESCTLF